jgi:hypothetical protein
MTRASGEIRDTVLSIRTRSSIKAIADRLGAEEDRSVTQIIERLLLTEADKRGWIIQPAAKAAKKAR